MSILHPHLVLRAVGPPLAFKLGVIPCFYLVVPVEGMFLRTHQFFFLFLHAKANVTSQGASHTHCGYMLLFSVRFTYG